MKLPMSIQLITYRFAEDKELIVDLLCRVYTVSVETMRIVSETPK